MPAVACALLLQTSVIFVLFLLQLSTLVLPSFCCCCHPWSPAVVAVAGDSFLLAFLLIMMSLLLLSTAVACISAVVDITAVAASTGVAGVTGFDGVPVVEYILY